MQIEHRIDDFFFTIFPTIKKDDNQSLIDTLQEYYSYGSFKPKVKIEDGFVIIELDTSKILSLNADYKKVISFCEQGRFSEAKPILNNLIINNPSISEYHRIMGQIISEEGNQEDAINCLIEALRWDPKNGWALLMMGNIFAKYRSDLPTARKYYDQALVSNPNDYITITNIGANLVKQGNIEEAKRYFNEALKINNEYPNTHYALGMIAEMESDLQIAFNSFIQTIKCTPPPHTQTKDGFYQTTINQINHISKRILETDLGRKIFIKYRHKLEFEGERIIDILEDNNIQTAAKIEFAENYKRDIHILKYKPNYPAFEHLIMHELVHLDYVIQARKNNENQLFISTGDHKIKFIKSLESTTKKLNKLGVDDESISKFSIGVFEGLNSQVFNTPIDLFIENFLYNEYPNLRAFQFISLSNMVKEGVRAVTDKKITDLYPKELISKSKIYNLVNAFQLRDLYGFDYNKDFNASKVELKIANDFYNEFLTHKEDKKTSIEYELILRWAKRLELDQNFTLIDESIYRDNNKKEISNDTIEVIDEEREMFRFQKTQEEIGTNMAIVMYMVGALQFFEGMTTEEIKKIAFEIAMQGRSGYNPDKKDYTLQSIPDKIFSGYQILSYYYVSWKLAIPDMLPQLQLPYSDEFKMASSLYKKESG